MEWDFPLTLKKGFVRYSCRGWQRCSLSAWGIQFPVLSTCSAWAEETALLMSLLLFVTWCISPAAFSVIFLFCSLSTVAIMWYKETCLLPCVRGIPMASATGCPSCSQYIDYFLWLFCSTCFLVFGLGFISFPVLITHKFCFCISFRKPVHSLTLYSFYCCMSEYHNLFAFLEALVFWLSVQYIGETFGSFLF